jgi:hypothetical protein
VIRRVNPPEAQQTIAPITFFLNTWPLKWRAHILINRGSIYFISLTNFFLLKNLSPSPFMVMLSYFVTVEIVKDTSSKQWKCNGWKCNGWKCNGWKCNNKGL